MLDQKYCESHLNWKPVVNFSIHLSTKIKISHFKKTMQVLQSDLTENVEFGLHKAED